MVSELIVADEEVVEAAGVLSEQPTTVTRAQTASKARTRFFIVSIQLAETKPTGQWGKIPHDQREIDCRQWGNKDTSPEKCGSPRKTARKTPDFDAEHNLGSTVPL